jgi:hypothetical protein
MLILEYQTTVKASSTIRPLTHCFGILFVSLSEAKTTMMGSTAIAPLLSLGLGNRMMECRNAKLQVAKSPGCIFDANQRWLINPEPGDNAAWAFSDCSLEPYSTHLVNLQHWSIMSISSNVKTAKTFQDPLAALNDLNDLNARGADALYHRFSSLGCVGDRDDTGPERLVLGVP